MSDPVVRARELARNIVNLERHHGAAVDEALNPIRHALGVGEDTDERLLGVLQDASQAPDDAAALAVFQSAAAERRRGVELHADWRGTAPAREWICDGWLGFRLTLFTGDGGRGKSRVALQLAAAIAGGAHGSWLPPDPEDAPTVPPPNIDLHGSPVLVSSWEDERDEVHRRLASMAAHPALSWADPERITERLHFADMAGLGPLWEVGAGGGVGALTTAGTELRAAAERIEARLLVIDPRAAAFAGNENDRAHVRAFVADWDRWARETRCAVLLVDHRPKGTAKEKPAAYAGSTDWHNAARSMWTLRNDGGGAGATLREVELWAVASAGAAHQWRRVFMDRHHGRR